MAEIDKAFSGALPKFYDTLTVPIIFEPYAADMAARVAELSPSAVLETAAGTGAVTRALAPLLADGARYVVTDLSQPMLDYAAQRQGPDARIEWRQADALRLPLEDAQFDVVFCQFGAMFFPDRVVGLAEARRVLHPGGHLLFSVWDRLEDNAFADEVTRALAGLFPHDPPRFLARIPHGYHNTAQIREDVRRAGFRHLWIDTRGELSRAASARDVATAFCHGTPLRGEIEARNPAQDALAEATEHVTEAIARRHGRGPVAGMMQAHIGRART